jgi:hypothetical protein
MGNWTPQYVYPDTFYLSPQGTWWAITNYNARNRSTWGYNLPTNWVIL